MLQFMQKHRQQEETTQPDEIQVLREQRQEAAAKAATANAALAVARQQILSGQPGAAERLSAAQAAATNFEHAVTGLDLKIAQLQEQARDAGAEIVRENQITQIISLAFDSQSREIELMRVVTEANEVLAGYAGKILDLQKQQAAARAEFRTLCQSVDPVPGTQQTRQETAEERGADLTALRRSADAWPSGGILAKSLAHAVHHMALVRMSEEKTSQNLNAQAIRTAYRS